MAVVPTKHQANLAAFDFLNTLPIVKSEELNPDYRKCFICHEPYYDEAPASNDKDNNEDKSSRDLPVKLPCGHILGLQCLTRWVLSSNYDNHCSLDRTLIVPAQDPDVPAIRGKGADLLDILAVFNGIVTKKRKAELLDLMGKQGVTERTIIVIEEYLKAFRGRESIVVPSVQQQRILINPGEMAEVVVRIHHQAQAGNPLGQPPLRIAAPVKWSLGKFIDHLLAKFISRPLPDLVLAIVVLNFSVAMTYIALGVDPAKLVEFIPSPTVVYYLKALNHFMDHSHIWFILPYNMVVLSTHGLAFWSLVGSIGRFVAKNW